MISRLKTNIRATFQVIGYKSYDYDDNSVNENINYDYGTGFAVWRDKTNNNLYIVTHPENIYNEENAVHFVIASDKQQFAVDIVLIDRMYGIAVLRIRNAPVSIPVVTLSLSRPMKGTTIYTVGWADSRDINSVSNGMIRSDYHTTNGVTSELVVSTYGSWTTKGAGIYLEDSGQCIGMLSWRDQTVLNGALSSADIRRAILAIQYQIRPENTPLSSYQRIGYNNYFIGVKARTWLGDRTARIHSMNLTHPALTGLGHVGIHVNSVASDSPAEAAGLTNETFIWAVTDKPSPSTNDWVVLHEEMSLNQAIDMFVRPTFRPLLTKLNGATLAIDNSPAQKEIYLLTTQVPNDTNIAFDPNNYVVRTLTLVKSTVFRDEFESTYDDFVSGMQYGDD
jgi:hypothetical protein